MFKWLFSFASIRPSIVIINNNTVKQKAFTFIYRPNTVYELNKRHHSFNATKGTINKSIPTDQF